MKATRHPFTPIALSVAIGLSLAGASAIADSPTSADTPATVATTSPELTQATRLAVSADGYQAMRMIRRARLAIFNGDTAAANAAIAAAGDSLAAVIKAAPTVQSTRLIGRDGQIVGEQQSTIAAGSIPIDAQVVWTDNLVNTPASRAHVATANSLLAKGQPRTAAEELRLAEVDTSFVWTLMPIASTRADVEQASKLMAVGKYFEASVALNAAENGLSTDTFVYVDTPAAAHDHKPANAAAAARKAGRSTS